MLALEDLKLSEVAALVGLVSGLLTALGGVVGYRYHKHALDAKDAQIKFMDQQLKGMQDQTPDTLRKRHEAVKETYEEEVTSLRAELSTLRAKLRDKSARLIDAETKLSLEFGVSKSFFNISDYELELRRLSSLIMISPWNPRTFPEGQDYAYEFFLKALKFLQRDPEFLKLTVEQASEWIMDYLFYPLISCIVSAPHLKKYANSLYQDFLDEIKRQGKLSDVLPLYVDLQRMTNMGADFSALQQYSTYQTLMISARGISGYPYPMN